MVIKFNMNNLLNRISMLTLFLMIISSAAFADDLLSVGFYTGFQHDACRLSEIDGDINTQNNVIIGADISLIYKNIFIKTGADTSFTITKGKVQSTETSLEKTDIKFSSVRFYTGLNIPVRLTGRIYTGIGAVFLMATGSIKTATGNHEISEFTYAPAFILGTEFSIAHGFSLFIDWEYAAGITSPTAQTSAGSYKDYSIDCTGSRFHMGLCYYIL